MAPIALERQRNAKARRSDISRAIDDLNRHLLLCSTEAERDAPRLFSRHSTNSGAIFSARCTAPGFPACV